MNNNICQSCGMPLTDDLLSINQDGTLNADYCKYCYNRGEFVDKVSMNEYIEMCSQFGSQAGMTNEQMKTYCQNLFPTLKKMEKQLEKYILKKNIFMFFFYRITVVYVIIVLRK